MDFSVYKNKLPLSGEQVMQQFGYGHITSHHTGKDSFVRRLYRDHYPRFHVYVSEVQEKVTFSMHLDQKEASYKGNRMHSGEYDGPLVEAEINNLKNFIVKLVQANQAPGIQPVAKTAEPKMAWWKFW